MLKFILGLSVGSVVVLVLFVILNIVKSDNCNISPSLKDLQKKEEEQSDTNVGCTFDE